MREELVFAGGVAVCLVTGAALSQPVNNQGGANTGNIIVAPAAVTYTAPAVSAVTSGGTAVTALSSGTIVTGCDIYNPSTSAALFWSVVTSASTTAGGDVFSIPAGGTAHCPYGTTSQTLSINATDNGHVFAAQGY